MCFLNSNTINGMEYAILSNWSDWLVKNQKAELDLIGRKVFFDDDDDDCQFVKCSKHQHENHVLLCTK